MYLNCLAMYNQIITSYKPQHRSRVLYVIETALDNGFNGLQFSWQASDRECYELGSTLRTLALKYRADFIVNNRLDLALALGADALHLGQLDLPVDRALEILPKGIKLGLTLNTLDQLKLAETYPIDYYGVGPIFNTNTKKNSGPSIGLEQLSLICSNTTKPVVAIGGITEENANAVRNTGAAGIAVIGAIYNSVDSAKSARQILEF